jgi:hypothetical protein
MADKVILIVTDGAMKEFVYEEHDRLLVGRAKECHIDLPLEDLTASRHDCVLMVKPPLARIRDMGSLLTWDVCQWRQDRPARAR